MDFKDPESLLIRKRLVKSNTVVSNKVVALLNTVMC